VPTNTGCLAVVPKSKKFSNLSGNVIIKQLEEQFPLVSPTKRCGKIHEADKAMAVTTHVNNQQYVLIDLYMN
jgi:hypothetical protein